MGWLSGWLDICKSLVIRLAEPFSSWLQHWFLLGFIPHIQDSFDHRSSHDSLSHGFADMLRTLHARPHASFFDGMLDHLRAFSGTADFGDDVSAALLEFKG